MISTSDQHMTDDQNLVIDLTTGCDSSRNSTKNSNSDDSNSSNSQSTNGVRRQTPTISDTNDFCCQFNTIEDTDVDVEVDDHSNDQIRK